MEIKVMQRSNRIKGKPREGGQSLVELALFVPLLLMMLSGLVEFGLLLNQYLNLMDGPREGARYGVSISPFVGTGDTDDPLFYDHVTAVVNKTIYPYSLDPSRDDVIITVVSIKNDDIYRRYPQILPSPSIAGQYRLYGHKTSKYTDAQIRTLLGTSLSPLPGAPKGGAVIVEMYYSYHQALALPWLLAFVPDPIQLYMSSVAPLPAATPPDPTPGP
jgi:hypothetical protein